MSEFRYQRAWGYGSWLGMESSIERTAIATSPSRVPRVPPSIFFITSALCPPSLTPFLCHARIIPRSWQRSVCPPPEVAKNASEQPFQNPCWKQTLFDILDSPE